MNFHIHQDKDYTSLTITDTLPADVLKLDSIKIGPYADTVISLENPDFDENSSTPINLVVNNYQYHEQGIRVTGTYTPSTGVIKLNIVPADGANADAVRRAGFGKDCTLKLRVFAELKV